MKNEDIAVIVDNGRTAFAYIGDYYEESSESFTVKMEKEVHSQIEKASLNVDEFKCPYIKRRRINLIKILGNNDTVSPYLQSAIARNWHSLSDLNDYSDTILSSCFDAFIREDKLSLTFRVKQERDINVLDLAGFVLNAAKILSDDTPESVSVKTTLHSPGDIVLQIFNFAQDKFPLLLCYLVIFGGKAGNYEFNSLLGVIKNIINAKHNRQKEKLELRKLSAETDLIEQQVIEKKLENIEKARILQLEAIESCGEPLSVAANNLEILPAENTIQDVIKAIESQNKKE